jgi:hypothetical protein
MSDKGSEFYRCPKCARVDRWSQGTDADYWCPTCGAETPAALCVAGPTPPAKDWEARWARLIKYARHPKTIPEGEIEVRADVLVAVDLECRALAREVGRLKEKADRIQGRLDLILEAPLTPEDAEAILDAIDPHEVDAIPKERIEEMVAYATNPDNARPDVVIDRLIAAARECEGFDPGTLEMAESWARKSNCP